MSKQLKSVYADRLKSHSDVIESGEHDTDFEMRDFLRELLDPDGATDVAVRSEVFVDLAAGWHGIPNMVEAILTLEGDFDSAGLDRDFIVTTLVVGRKMFLRVLHPDKSLDHSELEFKPMSGVDAFRHLVSSPPEWAPWADPLVVGLLSGRFGTRVQDSALLGAQNGLSTGESLSTESVVRTCIHWKRLDLLRQVADLGLPAPLKLTGIGNDHFEASTETGQWLDILSCKQQDGQFRATRTCFARQVLAFDKSPVGRALAEILAKHDPGHAFIASMAGSAGHALVMGSLMALRIQAAEVASPEAVQAQGLDTQIGVDAGADPAPLARRRSRHV